jgi:catechol 2,3-dioxygenase-like lactoylglutathione lyase family enzyme
MVKGIDHIVIAVNDLDTAVAGYTRLGFTVVRGGRHAGLGTHNALIAFADGAYFELIAFIPPLPAARHWWYSALAQGGGLVDFCARSEDLESDVAAFRKAGAAIGAPFAMERVRPDGYTVSWVLATTEGASRGVVPFFIRDTTPRDERVPRDRTHPNGVVGVRGLAVAVGDTDAIAQIYASALGVPGASIAREDLGANGIRSMIGPHELEFLEPNGQAGAIADHIRTRGPSPFEVTLDLRGGKAGQLDPATSHRARIILA